MNAVVQSIRMLAVLSLLTGLAYPLVVTGLSKALFSDQANGSLVVIDGKPVGSVLVGQSFSSDGYFWPRPSAVGYNPLPSGGSNCGPTSAQLRDSIASRAARLGAPAPVIPADLMHASGSGLDPHISPEAALFQIDRISAARGLHGVRRQEVRQLVERHIEPRQFGMLGEPRVNVLMLNLALDSLLR